MITGLSPDHAVPHLQTAATGPISQFEQRLLDHQTAIEKWFRQQWHKTPAPFYTSVDLRNAGFKVAPVDTNLFPAGFNNLNPAFDHLSIHAIQSIMERLCPYAGKVLLIPENHTRNTFYLENVAKFESLLLKAGFEVRVGTLLEEAANTVIDLPSGQQLRLHAILRNNNRLMTEDFNPCVVLLNNDLSAGSPALLENIEQKILPPLTLGWTHRLKSQHFTQYRGVAQEFAELVDIDPWLIDPLFRNCGEINFKTGDGEECLKKNVNALLEAIKIKYAEYGIEDDPFVVIKADAGTYGMGIMMVKSADEAINLNRKQRKKMSSAKEGLEISKVIMQEGVFTNETIGATNSVAEPVVYMIDRFVVGGFYRVHTQKGVNENLNAPGMHFEPLAFADCCSNPDASKHPNAEPNRFYAYGVIARLAMLAAAREIADAEINDTHIGGNAA